METQQYGLKTQAVDETKPQGIEDVVKEFLEAGKIEPGKVEIMRLMVGDNLTMNAPILVLADVGMGVDVPTKSSDDELPQLEHVEQRIGRAGGRVLFRKDLLELAEEQGKTKSEAATGTQKLRAEVAPLLDFELDTFQVECPCRVLDGQDVLVIIATGAGKSALIYIPLMVRQGTISIVISPTNFLQQDMMASMQKKGISAIAINSDTLTAAALASPPRNLWAEAKTGACRLILIGPETMKTPEYQSFITDENVRTRLGQFTVDELHAADEWSVDFRKDFQDIPTMRVRLPDHTTFVGLSASIEPGRQYESCVKLMGFRPGFHLEKRDCERRNVALIVRPIKYTTSGLEFRDLDWLVQAIIEKLSNTPKRLVFMQEIDGGHRLVNYLRSLLPPHLQKDARRLIRHHHSLACPDCKAEGMESLYKCGEDRDCLIHVSTDVLTVGVDIPGLEEVILFGKISSASALVQRAGRPARERGATGRAYIYVTKADMAAALEYIDSEAGKLDVRVLTTKDPTSHVRTAETSDAATENPAEPSTSATPTDEMPVAPLPEQESASAVTTSMGNKARKSKKKSTQKPIPAVAKPGNRTCTSLLLVFAAHARNRCITRQLNMIYGNPGVDKDCGRCSSCVGDTIPEPRAVATADPPDVDVPDAEPEKIPGFMKPQVKDLKVVTEKLQKCAQTIRWSQPRRTDSLLVGAKVFLPPDVISAITADFLHIISEDIFRLRIHQWKYAAEYGHTLWNAVKILVEELRKELISRHDEALAKQRQKRADKAMEGLRHIKKVTLLLPPRPLPTPVEDSELEDGAAELEGEGDSVGVKQQYIQLEPK
ncbi:P-loop containing nucleoside triphosphate hydrolase protein [Mycena galericulata]|nr:P-loop containing nucleoside triphosphate hydrolase protein [Mycena galericulata]